MIDVYSPEDRHLGRMFTKYIQSAYGDKEHKEIRKRVGPRLFCYEFGRLFCCAEKSPVDNVVVINYAALVGLEPARLLELAHSYWLRETNNQIPMVFRPEKKKWRSRSRETAIEST